MNNQFTRHEDDDIDGWDPTATAAQINIYIELLDVKDTTQDTPFHKNPPIDLVKFKKVFKNKAKYFIDQRVKDIPRIGAQEQRKQSILLKHLRNQSPVNSGRNS